MKRRTFKRNTGLLSAASLLPSYTIFAQNRRLKSIGVQLFSLPKLLAKDFDAGLQLIAELGYNEIQLFGPYDFSAESNKKFWKNLEPLMGFSGSGFFGHSAMEVKTMLKNYDLKATAAHTDLDTLRTKMPELAKTGKEVGYKYVVLPAIPEEERTTLDDYKRLADDFNRIGKNAKEEGIRFAYHNHGYGLQGVNGQIPFQIILDNTDSDLVFFEMDVFWTIAGKADPVEYLKKYPNRFKLMHLKDMSKKVQFSGDGGNPNQWQELFPFLVSVGDGILNFKEIIDVAKKSGVKHFYVEQDVVANPEIALQKSVDYLKSI